MRVAVSAAAAVVACGLWACAEDQAEFLPTLPPQAQSQAPTDPGINPNDTYLLFDADFSTQSTISLAEPIVDPATGLEVSTVTFSDTVATTYRVEAGYDYDGVLRATLVGTWSPAIDSLALRLSDAYQVVVSNGLVYEFGPNGAALLDVGQPTDPWSSGNSAPPPTQPLQLLGSDLLYGDILAGVVSDSEPSPVEPQAARQSSILAGSLSPSAEDGQARATVSQPRGDRQRGERHQTYRKQGSKWVLEVSSLEDDVEVNGVRLQTTARLLLRNVRWGRNEAQDQQRRRRNRTAAGGSAMPTNSFLGPVPVVYSSNEVPCDVCEPDTLTPPPDTTPPPPPPSGAKNIVFQHGLGEAADVWSRMRGWLRPQFLFGVELAPQLNATARPGTQASQLASYLAATGASEYIIVAHSMGGLVAREVAHERPDLVAGVLSVGTPHAGAFIALQLKPTVTRLLQFAADRLFWECASRYSDLACFIADVIVRNLAPDFADWMVDPFQPPGPARDMRPPSLASNPYLTDLNAVAEAFPRVGLVNQTSKRWVWIRTLVEKYCSPDDGRCGGRVWVRATNRFYNSLRVGEVVAILTGHTSAANAFALMSSSMDYIDNLWDFITTRRELYTDGLVQGSSQYQPRATENFVLRGADSHSGEPRSDKVRDVITQNQVLERFFGLQRRQ